jgi:hypothetical protein
MTSDRQRGVMLRKMDRDALIAAAVSHLSVSHPDVQWVTVNPEWDYVSGRDADGNLYVICTEGVGWEVAHAKPFIMWVSPSWVDPNGETLGANWGANTPVYLHPDEVERLTTDEEVDIADFIREFGSRLEGNFALWHRTFTKKATA